MPIIYQEHDRERAIHDVNRMIQNPQLALSPPDRECAFALADYHKITTWELMNAVCEEAKKGPRRVLR